MSAGVQITQDAYSVPVGSSVNLTLDTSATPNVGECNNVYLSDDNGLDGFVDNSPIYMGDSAAVCDTIAYCTWYPPTTPGTYYLTTTTDFDFGVDTSTYVEVTSGNTYDFSSIFAVTFSRPGKMPCNCQMKIFVSANSDIGGAPAWSITATADYGTFSVDTQSISDETGGSPSGTFVWTSPATPQNPVTFTFSVPSPNANGDYINVDVSYSLNINNRFSGTFGHFI